MAIRSQNGGSGSGAPTNNVLMEQANTLCLIADALEAWHDQVAGKNEDAVTDEDGQATLDIMALVARHAELLRQLLNDLGCNPILRRPLIDLLDRTTLLDDIDMRGQHFMAEDFAGTQIWGIECSIPKEFRKWANELRRKHREANVDRAADNPPDPEATLSPAVLAKGFGLPKERLRKRLERHKKTHPDCYVELAERGLREAKYLYRVKDVMPVIEALRASIEASSKRPAEDNS